MGFVALGCLSAGICSGIVFVTGLIVREWLIELWQSLSRIDIRWSIGEKNVLSRWRFETVRLLLTAKQRMVLVVCLYSLLTVLGILGISGTTLAGWGVLGGLATILVGAKVGVLLGIVGIWYVRDSDPSVHEEWNQSEAHETYVEGLVDSDALSDRLADDISEDLRSTVEISRIEAMAIEDDDA